jgi:hypothetical protein
MKQFFLFASVFLLFGVLSCNKKEDTDILNDLPNWAIQRIESLTAKGESCEIIMVALYEFEGKYYYNIDFAYSSCRMCKLYNESGNSVTTSEKLPENQFKFMKFLSACK